MPTTRDYDQLNDRVASLLQNTIDQLGPQLVENPQLAEVLNRYIDEQVGKYTNGASDPPDGGLADLIGLGATTPASLGDTRVSPGVTDYDDTVVSERILASGDAYYLMMHERLGVFRVMAKLQEQFRAGTLRISNGPGAYGLYKFDKHGIVRYRERERWQMYRRVFGYGIVETPASRPNRMFDGLFRHFISETAKYWRDKRISEVIRERAHDPTFGSIAIVRRAALDLRNNLKNSSYGNLSVMRVETSQALAEAFKVLGAADLRAQFGAENAWDLIELVLWQYFGRSVQASTINRMATAGREIIRWLSEPYVLKKQRTDFETLLYRIAESAEEWISSDEGMRASRVTPPPRQVFMPGPPMSGSRRSPVFAQRVVG
ncbi:MAG: hypothetical protein JO036_17280 [Candidatus Eremiobacteraeota bacterium]|nr:hypothetical protein [Candidatus Eremiobacteraeota bacterium]